MSEQQSTETIFRGMFSLARSIDRFHQAGLLRVRAGVDLDRALHPVLITIGYLTPLRTTELATALALQVSTVSRHVGRLIDLELVARTAVDEDRRAAVLSLTASGEAALESIRSAWTEAIRGTLERIECADDVAFAEVFNSFATELGSDDLPTGISKTTSPAGERHD